MENHRRSFRLDVEIGFEGKLVSEAKLKSGIARLKRQPTWNAVLPSAMHEIDAALVSALKELKITAPRAAGAIELLNQKVDLLRLSQHWSESVKELPLRRVNLSATGIAFDYKSPVEVGRAMHCTLTLPSLVWTLQLFARVISCRPVPEAGYKVCLDFEYIRDEDGEQLIRFNLLEQQQRLVTAK
jgi:hypothetical protein